MTCERYYASYRYVKIFISRLTILNIDSDSTIDRQSYILVSSVLIALIYKELYILHELLTIIIHQLHLMCIEPTYI